MPLDDEPFRGPFPKVGKRLSDKKASRRALLPRPECVVCGKAATNVHHVVLKSQQGSDVPENMAPVCGSGTTGCHGAIHGNPYLDGDKHRWTQKEARSMIGVWILGDPERLQYALDHGGPRLLKSYGVKEWR